MKRRGFNYRQLARAIRPELLADIEDGRKATSKTPAARKRLTKTQRPNTRKLK